MISHPAEESAPRADASKTSAASEAPEFEYQTVRLRLDIAYDGTDFHGWARQKDPALRTVQGVIEDALSLIARQPVTLTVAGRTDAGVHALGQVAHCDFPVHALDQRSIAGDPGRLVRRLAKLLDSDVSVRGVARAPQGFDARFSALSREYVYRVTTHPAGPLPQRVRDTAQWGRPVDLELLQATADILVGLHDFAAFCRAKPHATTIREVQEFRWRDVSTPTEPQVYEATVVADAFCWNMVRSLVGCCLSVGQGKKEVSFAHRMLGETARHPEVPLAPAAGLTLVQAVYPNDEALAERAVQTRARRELPKEPR